MDGIARQVAAVHRCRAAALNQQTSLASGNDASGNIDMAGSHVDTGRCGGCSCDFAGSDINTGAVCDNNTKDRRAGYLC